MAPKFSLRERVFLYNTYIKCKKSCGRTRRKFRMKFPHAPMPCVNTIRALAKRFRETGSVKDRKSNRQRRVLTEEKLDDIAERLEHSPKKTLKRLAQETGISESSARNATKLLELKYKSPVFQHGGNSNTGSKEIEVDTAASTSTSQSVVAVSNLSSLNENAGGISDSESEEDSNHSADILPLQEELLQDSTSQHTVLLSETASSVNSDTLILPSTSSSVVRDAEIPSSSHAVSSTAQSNSAIQLISSQQTNRGAKRPLEDHETSPGLGNKQRRSGGEIAQENVFAATLDRLEHLSDKASMLGAHDDDLDNFGKYVASLLRGLPSERATELQKEVIDLILKSHVKDEPDSSEVDPLALEEQLPPQSSSDTTQTTTVQRKNFEDIISASRRLVEKSRTPNVQQTNEVNGRSSGKLASSGQNADSTLLQRNNTSEKRLLPDESPANDETECDDPVLETKRVDAALKRLECISEKVNMLSEKDDNFDTFGKYVASLLRYISAEKAVELQQELINLILKARANTKT